MQEHLFRHFLSPGRNGFLNVSVTFIDKTDPIYIYIYADLVASVFCLYIYLVTWDDS